MTTDARTYEKSVDAEENLTRDSSRTETSPAPEPEPEPIKQTWTQRLWRNLKTPGSAPQIILAALLAIAIGLAVSTTVSDIPAAAPAVLQLPGTLWLRALRATVLPLIITAIILAVQNLKAMTSQGSKLARWTISYYVLTTVLAVVHSQIMTSLVWTNLMTVADGEALDVDSDLGSTIEDQQDQGGNDQPHQIVIRVATSFIPQNVFAALAGDELLAVLVSAIVAGCLIKGPNSSLLRAIKEIDRIVFTIIDFLIKLAPVGVFFLVLSNLMRLNIADIGQNLGVLIGASLAGMFLHLFVILPLVFLAFTRQNPITWWLKHSPAWILAWGSASSAATLPVTMKTLDKNGVPKNVYKFTAPLGALINMDGTAIYFPVVVVFLAMTQPGITLNAGDYALIVILSVLSSIATTPIPSSSLVLTIMIAGSVGIPITGMYGVVIAIDWFIDRFRTATNVSGDIFACKILEKMTGINDDNLKEDEISKEQEILDGLTNENQAAR